MTKKNPFSKPVSGGLSKGHASVECTNLHNRSDVDSSDQAQHHTIGGRTGQAASGYKFEKLLAAGAFGRVGDFQFNDTLEETEIWLRADGRLLNIAEYPEAYALYGVTHGGDGITTFAIPDVRERNLRGYKTGAEGSFYAYASTVGNNLGDWVNNFAHTHPIPNQVAHTHNITSEAAHNHSIPAQAAGVDTTAATGGGVNLVTRGSFNGHNHGGTSGDSGTHDHGGATGAGGSHDHGGATVTTDWTDATASFWGDAVFRRDSPSYVTNVFVRVKLGI